MPAIAAAKYLDTTIFDTAQMPDMLGSNIEHSILVPTYHLQD